jgi:predicted RNase H-like HicB family nuclease
MAKTKETITAMVSVSDALNAYDASTVAASEGAINMILHGALVCYLAIDCAEPGKADSLGNIKKTLADKVTRDRKANRKPVKDKMLAVFVRCSTDVFRKWTGRGDYGSAHPAVLDAMAQAKTPQDAVAAMKAYLLQGFKGDDALSINAIRRYLGHATGGADPKDAAAKLASAVSSAVKAIAADKLDTGKAAAIVANTVPVAELLSVIVSRLEASNDYALIGNVGNKLITLSDRIRKDSEADKARAPKPVNQPGKGKPEMAQVAAH